MISLTRSLNCGQTDPLKSGISWICGGCVKAGIKITQVADNGRKWVLKMSAAQQREVWKYGQESWLVCVEQWIALCLVWCKIVFSLTLDMKVSLTLINCNATDCGRNSSAGCTTDGFITFLPWREMSPLKCLGRSWDAPSLLISLWRG
jgi:hypothetical protein